MLPVLFCGCLTTSHSIKNENQVKLEKKAESPVEVKSALGSVAGALSGQKVSDEDLNNLVRDLRKDTEAQSAAASVTHALSGSAANVQYCPVDGQRFSGKIKICPVHKVELKPVE